MLSRKGILLLVLLTITTSLSQDLCRSTKDGSHWMFSSNESKAIIAYQDSSYCGMQTQTNLFKYGFADTLIGGTWRGFTVNLPCHSLCDSSSLASIGFKKDADSHLAEKAFGYSIADDYQYRCYGPEHKKKLRDFYKKEAREYKKFSDEYMAALPRYNEKDFWLRLDSLISDTLVEQADTCFMNLTKKIMDGNGLRILRKLIGNSTLSEWIRK